MIERKRRNACVLRRECLRACVCAHAYMRMLEHGDAHIRTYMCTYGATSCVRTCGTVYDSLQFIVWTSICQVSGRGRYRRFRRIFGVENYQLSQWNSIRIVHQRLCRPRARERVSVQTHAYTHIQHTRTRAHTQTRFHARRQQCDKTRVRFFGKPTSRTLRSSQKRLQSTETGTGTSTINRSYHHIGQLL